MASLFWSAVSLYPMEDLCFAVEFTGLYSEACHPTQKFTVDDHGIKYDMSFLSPLTKGNKGRISQ